VVREVERYAPRQVLNFLGLAIRPFGFRETQHQSHSVVQLADMRRNGRGTDTGGREGCRGANRERMRVDVCDSKVKVHLNFVKVADLHHNVQKCT
jgi:hypothetical protein